MRTIAAIIYPNFQLLDLFGPLDMFGMVPDELQIITVAESATPVASSQGPKIVPDRTFDSDDSYDIIIVPGGMGSREEIGNKALLSGIRSISDTAEIVSSVCTGSALLAKAGILDGKRATSNKAAFDWVTQQGPHVNWQPKARWVVDGKYFTSSGVSAGMDMSLALIEHLFGEERAGTAAKRSEYRWINDPDDDPFCADHKIS